MTNLLPHIDQPSDLRALSRAQLPGLAAELRQYVLESVARAHSGRVVAGAGRTRIFLRPPDRISAVDALITNFHLPESTLLMLVAAFTGPGDDTRGRQMALHAYREAIRLGYRFFSYGDAMFIT